jgi:CubicO group peptidase (beta-lactamase class C family)
MGTQDAVTAHTLFSIASNTKAFTAAALEILIEEHKLKWDDPIINYLPWFKMSDPWVTAQFTVRDVLVHHSGIPGYAGDILIFPPSDYSRKDIISKLKSIPLVNSFRTTYAYDNIMYLAAGELISVVSGMSWEDFIKVKILNKLDMQETVSRFTDFKKQVDISSGHSPVRGKIEIDEEFFAQAIGDAGNAAGGIASNALDMSKWLMAQLDSGRGKNGQQIYQSSAVNELWKMVRPIPISKNPIELFPSQMNFYGYALGVRTYNYGKYKVIGHGGKLDGFVSQVVMIPELKLGIAVLTNQESTGAYWSIIFHLLDYYLHNPRFDWIAGYQKQLEKATNKSNEERTHLLVQPVKNAQLSLTEDKIIAKYEDSFYGQAIISKVGNKLQLQFSHTPQFIADLTPFQYQTYTAKFHNPTLRADSYVTFTVAPDGNIESFKMKIIDPDSDISFDDLVFKLVK